MAWDSMQQQAERSRASNWGQLRIVSGPMFTIQTFRCACLPHVICSVYLRPREPEQSAQCLSLGSGSQGMPAGARPEHSECAQSLAGMDRGCSALAFSLGSPSACTKAFCRCGSWAQAMMQRKAQRCTPLRTPGESVPTCLAFCRQCSNAMWAPGSTL